MNNGYAICLNRWLDDEEILKKDLLPFLLRISSLTAEKGFCYASNEYLAEKLKVSTVTISRKIKTLISLGYIEAEYKKQGALIILRKLRLTQMIKTIIIQGQKRLTQMIKIIIQVIIIQVII